MLLVGPDSDQHVMLMVGPVSGPDCCPGCQHHEVLQLLLLTFPGHMMVLLLMMMVGHWQRHQ